MRAKDLFADFPTVTGDTLVSDAAQMLAGQNLPGLIVVDGRGRPVSILPGTQVLRLAVPSYCQEDPALARVVDEAAADVFMRELGQLTVASALSRERNELPVVSGEATVLEVAALMARTRSPVVAVVDRGGGMVGAITLDAMLDRLFAA